MAEAQLNFNKTTEQPNSETARLQLEWVQAKAEAMQKLKDALGDNETWESIRSSAGQFETAFLTQAVKLKQQGGDPKAFAETLRDASNGYFAHLTSENLKPEVAQTALGGFLAAVSLTNDNDYEKRGFTSLKDRARNMIGLLTQKHHIPPSGK
jgi:hypothetical protein